MNKKHIKINELFQKKKLNAILLINTSLNKIDPNIFYFTGKTFEYCAMLFTKKTCYLIVPELDYGRAKETMKNCGCKIKIIKHRNILELLKILKVKGRVGINYKMITLAEHSSLKKLKCKFIDVSGSLVKMRSEKTEDEIKTIKISCNYADKIMQKLFLNIKKNKFKTEKEILDYLENETKTLGLKTSFKPIVASGKNASFPHHDCKDTIRKGFCVIDFGVKYQGYCSDITRTIYFGKPSKKEIDFYALVLKANNESIEFLKENKTTCAIDKNCRKILGKFEKNFIHGLGHGIGVEIHEHPNLSSFSKDTIRKNQVFTIEPGIYFKNKFGIRIEDDVMINNSGKTKILTKTSKELMCFKI